MAFEDLTWDDLSEWAGSRVVTRGKSYRRQVEDLRVTADGKLLAWVRGGDRYATLVSLSRSGDLASVCTCPYAIACKHAVATVLSYLDAVQAGKTVPVADEDDERLELLLAIEEEDADSDEDEDEWPSLALAKRVGKRRSGKDPEESVRGYLESLSQRALLDFTSELAADFPDVRRRILDRAELKSGDVTKLVGSTRREIDAVSAEPGWTHHWSNEGHTPDYSRVRERMELLLSSGHADAVVELGGHLLDCGIRQVEMSDDEGETGREIAECMDVAFRALKSSGKTGAERLLWEIDARLKDDYCILEGINGLLENGDAFTQADWSTVADELAQRMEAVTVAAKQDGEGSSRGYRRQAVMRWLLDALEHAGRAEEVTAILLREAEITDCYVELVDHLLATKQRDAAEEWARKGFEKTVDSLPGIAWGLEERLREIARRKRNRPLNAAYRALEFFDRPDERRYAEVRKATQPLGYWDAIRPMLLSWLETGTRPDVVPQGNAPRRGRRGASTPSSPSSSQPAWPLPPTGLTIPREKGGYRHFPDRETLIAVAMQEKRNDDVLRWYHHGSKRAGWGMGHLGDAVAAAVQETHPDEALAIWKSMAVSQIAVTKPSAYQSAGMYLGKMRAVYERLNRRSEWDDLLARLRTEHGRKKRLLEILDGLEGKRTRILKR